jgi:phosphatidylethanolamine-binding protein (PEBP) family uncharacterized protein
MKSKLFGMAVLALVACVATSPASAMSASFSWAGIAACSGPSPAFTVTGAPAGTTNLRFVMRDQNVPDFNHGGGTVPFSGGNVAQGAIAYRGPCPPGGETHLYVWTVEALDGGGRVLATATTQGRFPPK